MRIVLLWASARDPQPRFSEGEVRGDPGVSGTCQGESGEEEGLFSSLPEPAADSLPSTLPAALCPAPQEPP